MPDERDNTLRLFVACPISDDAKQTLAGVQDEFRRAGFDRLRFVRPEGIHITLKFLGAVAANRVAAITGILAAAIQPFELTLTVQGLGGFGGGRMAGRVIWAGVRGEWEALGVLAKRIDLALEPLGFAPEGRPFRPHLTLARMPQDMAPERRREFHQFLERFTFHTPPPMIISEVNLMHSHLGPGGSRYEQLASFPENRGETS